jgi:hypothetical protein
MLYYLELKIIRQIPQKNKFNHFFAILIAVRTITLNG